MVPVTSIWSPHSPCLGNMLALHRYDKGTYFMKSSVKSLSSECSLEQEYPFTRAGITRHSQDLGPLTGKMQVFRKPKALYPLYLHVFCNKVSSWSAKEAAFVDRKSISACSGFALSQTSALTKLLRKPEQITLCNDIKSAPPLLSLTGGNPRSFRKRLFSEDMNI